jgi:hypothetical protein
MHGYHATRQARVRTANDSSENTLVEEEPSVENLCPSEKVREPVHSLAWMDYDCETAESGRRDGQRVTSTNLPCWPDLRNLFANKVDCQESEVSGKCFQVNSGVPLSYAWHIVEPMTALASTETSR